MSVQLDLSQLPPPAQKILGPKAPGPMKMMAAKGIVPGLKPADIATVLVGLAAGDDPKVAEAARGTLDNLPPPILTGALGAQLQAPVIRALAERKGSEATVVESLLRMAAIEGDVLVLLAERADEASGEIIATNERRMLEHPRVIEKLYMNKKVRMSTANRLIELAVRNGVELSIPAFKEISQEIQNELIPEPSEEPTFSDVLFKESGELARELTIDETDEHDDTHEFDEEDGAEKVREKFKPLHVKLGEMSVTEKIRTALLGESAERLLLIRDTNRLVAESAAKSPRFRENDAVRATKSRNIGDGVLRIIAMNRELTRSYQVKKNLVENPRTPFSFSSRFIPLLRDNDLRQLAKSKNIPGAVSQAVRQQLLRKQKGRS